MRRLRKALLWGVLLFGVVIGAAGCKNAELPLPSGRYEVSEVTYHSSSLSLVLKAGENTPLYDISDEMKLSSRGEQSTVGWALPGDLEEIELTRENFDQLFPSGDSWQGDETAASLRRKTVRAWYLVHGDSHSYLLQQKNGGLYLASGFYDAAEKDDPYSDDTNLLWVFRLTPTEEQPPEEDEMTDLTDLVRWQSCAVGFHTEAFQRIMIDSEGDLQRFAVSAIQYLPVVKIDSREELETFLNEKDPFLDFGRDYYEEPSFAAAAEEYDEEFFRSQTLFLLYTTAPTTAHRYGIEEVKCSEATLLFCVEEYAPPVGDTAMEGWLLAVSVPTEELENVTRYSALISSVTQ